jgi:hypothetical protein
MTSGTGSCIVTAAQAGDDNYNGVQEQGTITALKAAQTIAFGSLSDVMFELAATRSLSATASSGLPVSFASTTLTTCSVAGSTVTLLRAGDCTVRATQSGDANYHAASAEERTFKILPWTVTGFYQPVDMGGGSMVFNVVKGGSTVPLKFEVFSGNTERTDVSAIRSFTQAKVSCPSNPVVDEIEILSTGGTSLRYDGTGGQFIQNWQTLKQPGACYRVTMTTQDYSTIVAFFLLK